MSDQDENEGDEGDDEDYDTRCHVCGQRDLTTGCPGLQGGNATHCERLPCLGLTCENCLRSCIMCEENFLCADCCNLTCHVCNKNICKDCQNKESCQECGCGEIVCVDCICTCKATKQKKQKQQQQQQQQKKKRTTTTKKPEKSTAKKQKTTTTKKPEKLTTKKQRTTAPPSPPPQNTSGKTIQQAAVPRRSTREAKGSDTKRATHTDTPANNTRQAKQRKKP